MYIATVRFADLQDNKRIYEAGEQYPRLGFVVSAERLAELAGSDNLSGRPLIKRTETALKAAEPEPIVSIKKTTRAPKKGNSGRKKG